MSYICKERLIETIRNKCCIEDNHCACMQPIPDERCRFCNTQKVIDVIKNSEPADVDEVKQGSWVEKVTPYGDNLWVECDKCGWQLPMVEHLSDKVLKDYKYCPHCGAVMDEE